MVDFEEEVTALSDQFSLLDRKMTSVSAIATKFGDRLQVRSSLAVMLPLQDPKTIVAETFNNITLPSKFLPPCTSVANLSIPPISVTHW